MGRADGEKHIGFSQIVVEIWLKPCRTILFFRPINGTAIE